MPSASIVLEPRRYRVKVGARYFGEVSLSEARELQDALTVVLRAHSGVAEQVVEIIAAHFHSTTAELRGGSRCYRIVKPRMVAMALLSEFLPAWHDSLTAGFFERERSMVTYARKWLSDREDTEPKFRVEIAGLRARVQAALESEQEETEGTEKPHRD